MAISDYAPGGAERAAVSVANKPLDFNLEGMILATAEWADVGGWATGKNILANYRLWCLGHNFDVVAALLNVKKLEYLRGFNAAYELAEFVRDTPRKDN